MFNNFSQALSIAFGYILNLEGWFFEIIFLSILVNTFAALIACLLAIPLAGFLAQTKNKYSTVLIIACQTLLALPPVVLGLAIYLLISKTTNQETSSLLYTPYIILIAQTIIVFPIALSLSYRIFDEKKDKFLQHFMVLGLSKLKVAQTLAYEARVSLTIVFISCLGRAMAEVSSILILGGNIKGYTRFITSSIVLETSKGDLATALAFGICLLVISLIINIFVYIALVKK